MPKNAGHFLAQVPPRLQLVLQAALDRSRLGEMSIHGPGHWLKVFRNVNILAAETSGADLAVCELFALLHDCARQNESFDPEHGRRAALYAGELMTRGAFAISQHQMMLLSDACTHHDEGQISADPTIGVCWDADRLDLPRVGIVVDPNYLSTEAARQMKK